MSLHTLAQHLQSAGRGEDKVLVHMTPREVSGLQSLAMAHGGSLTINPETGLPEAGFLSAILPMVAGAALTVGTGGVINPLTAGLIVGGAGAVATGSLQKGLMMGLGAYGGGGLAAGLGAGAAGAAGTAGSLGSAQTIAAQNAANQAAASASQFGQTMGSGPMQIGMMPTPPTMTTPPIAGVQGFVPGTPSQAFNPQETLARSVVQGTAPQTAATQGASSVEAATSAFDRFKSIPGKAYDLITGTGPEAEKAREDFLKANKPYLITGGIGTLAMSREEPKMPTNQEFYNPTAHRMFGSTGTGKYTAGPMDSLTGERTYRFAADGGLMDLPVARMSQQNMTGGNQNYPMAQIKPYGYAVPRNNPISQDVIKPMDYQSVDPYTGEQKFAGGGLASLVSMKTGGFVSKLKAVPKPTEIKPKLQDVSPFDKKVASLEKYSNVEEVQNRFNDIQNQIKDLQQQKKDRTTDSQNAAKDYNAAIAQINKDKANRLKELNTEFTNRIKEVQNDKGRSAKERQAAISDIQKEQKSAISSANTEFSDAIKNRQAEYNKFKTEYSGSVKDIDSRIVSLNKEASTAKNATTLAKQYQEAVSARDKVIAANELATNKAKEQNEAAMAKYQSYQDALEAEKKTWQEETGRKATGLQSISPVTAKTKLTEEEISKLPYTLGPKGEKIYSQPLEKTTITPFKAVPGFSGVQKILEEKDVIDVFQDVAGRRPTQEEISVFLGEKGTQAGIAKYAMSRPDVAAKTEYTPEDVVENWKYYIGRDPSKGEIENVMKQVRAGKIVNFNQLRTYIQTRPEYLQNINKVAEQIYTGQLKSAEDVLKEQERLSSSLTMGQIRAAYQDALQRTPTLEEAEKYIGAQQTQGGLADLLRGTEEYKKLATTPLVQTPSVVQPAPVMPQPTSYAPGTVLSYKPEEQKVTGLDVPQEKGLLQFPEALYPATPTFMQQLGIQGLAAQAAAAAPPLQTGLQFGAPQTQNVFGFQPYGQTTKPPQTVEEIIAAFQAQQKQGATGMAAGGYAGGGYHLGDYSDGGRLLKGPGDGVSDSIPASIGGRQPARLADGEFVIPARIVSELGNGSTDAGARKLYAMMDRIQRARRKSVGKDRVAVDSKAEKLLPV